VTAAQQADDTGGDGSSRRNGDEYVVSVAMTTESGARTNVDLYAALLQGRMHGDDALEASQKLLQVLMDSSANAVFWKDRQSRYLGCNRVFAAFAGVEPDDLIGKSDRDMPWADDAEFGADWFMDWDAHVAETGEPVVGIVERLRRAGGDLRWVETQKVPLRDLDGEVIGILGTFEDVTERRAAEERLNGTLKDLDKRVQQRTRDLERAIESLRREVDDRVRVQAEERQQRAYAEALRDTASAMAKTLDANEVMEHVLIGVERLVSNDLTAILLIGADDRLEIARCRVGFGYAKPVEEADGSPPIESLTVIRELHDDRESVIFDEPAVALGPAGSVLGAALQVGDRRIGFVVLESVTKGFFTTAHAERLRAIADQAAAAISNARLVGQASELAAAEERQRLSRELHDAVNQTLWTASLTADSLLRDVEVGSELHRRLQRLRTLTSGAQAEMRTLLLELRPHELVEVDLGELLGHLVAAMECRKKMDVTVELEPVELEPAQRVAFYRIAQEALTNITRHAAATVVSLTLRKRSDGGLPVVELRVVDNGRGFDVDNVSPGHLGLSIMRERADAIGAQFALRAAPGHGTDLTIRL
jgi:PAS domain S-box-containing protein